MILRVASDYPAKHSRNRTLTSLNSADEVLLVKSVFLLKELPIMNSVSFGVKNVFRKTFPTSFDAFLLQQVTI